MTFPQRRKITIGIRRFSLNKPACFSWGRVRDGLTRLVRANLDSVRDEIQELRETLEENHTPLTGCRLLNALMWAVLSGNDHWLRELA